MRRNRNNIDSDTWIDDNINAALRWVSRNPKSWSIASSFLYLIVIISVHGAVNLLADYISAAPTRGFAALSSIWGDMYFEGIALCIGAYISKKDSPLRIWLGAPIIFGIVIIIFIMVSISISGFIPGLNTNGIYVFDTLFPNIISMGYLGVCIIAVAYATIGDVGEVNLVVVEGTNE